MRLSPVERSDECVSRGQWFESLPPPFGCKWVLGLLGEFVGCSRDGERGGKTREKGLLRKAGNTVQCSGATWLFDIDTLTKTMNYQPVTACNQSNPSAGVQEQFDAEKAREEIEQQYVLFLVWSYGSTNPQNTDGDAAFDKKEPEFERLTLTI
nr:hypothetical protein [Tanacetum cinerariifolium]